MDPTTDDYVYALNFFTGVDANTGTDENAIKSIQLSTIDTNGQKSEGSILPGIGLDLSGDPTGCIRSVELFTNTAVSGGWFSS